MRTETQADHGNTKKTLQKMNAEYKEYLQVAGICRSRCNLSVGKAFPWPTLTAAGGVPRRVSILGQNLGKAHYDSRNLLLAQANETLKHVSTGWCSARSVCCCPSAWSWPGWLRDMIAPLRVKLVETPVPVITPSRSWASLGMLAAGLAHEIRESADRDQRPLCSSKKKKFNTGSQEQHTRQARARESPRAWSGS